MEESYKSHIKNALKKIEEHIEQNQLMSTEVADVLEIDTTNVRRFLQGSTYKSAYGKIYKYCLHYKLNLGEIMGYEVPGNRNYLSDSSLLDLDVLDKHKSYIYTPNNRYLRQWLNNVNDPEDAFYFYTNQTSRSSTDKYLKGKLRIYKEFDKKGREYVKVNLIIGGEYSEDGWCDPIVYYGNMVMVDATRACFIILGLDSNHSEEVSSISFNFSDNSNRMDPICVVAVCNTISSSRSHQRALAEKAIISNVELSDKDLKELDAVLSVNTAQLYIDKSKVSAIEAPERFIDMEKTYYKVKNKIGAETIESMLSDEGWKTLQNLIETLPYVRVSTDYDRYLSEFIRNKKKNV